jgi:hypothetical protein
MSPRAISSLDTVEMVMVIEEVFEIAVPGNVDDFRSPRELVDRMEAALSTRRPNKAAAALLRKLAKDRQQPELAEGLEGTWRREQIAAVVREWFADAE